MEPSGISGLSERAADVGKVFINDLVVQGIIGVNDSEREVPQAIVISLDLFTDLSQAGATDDIADCIDYQRVADKVTAHAESARRFTVEALAADIARIGLAEPGVNRVRVRVEKPGAVRACRSVGVEIERARSV
jgi:FolB domain-containing protein